MSPAAVEILSDREALSRIEPGAITALTEAATVGFGRPDHDEAQRAAHRRVIDISEACCTAAADSDRQRFAAAFVGDQLAGYVIATLHDEKDRELDWLMVHPDHHGAGIAPKLMRAGMDWLGLDRTQWLNVIRHNERAIRFYRRFGFQIDPDAPTAHAIPHWIMRRPPGPLPD